MKNISPENKIKTNLKKEMVVFLGLLTLFTLIHFLWFYFNYGSWNNVPPYTTFVHMLIPASSAIICLVIFRSPALTNESKFFLGIFTLYVIVFLIESFYRPLIPFPLINWPVVKAAPILSSIIAIFGFISLVALNLRKNWRNHLSRAKLWFGKNRAFFMGFSILFALIMILLNYLNHVFGFGAPLLEYNPINFLTTYLILMALSFFIVWPQYFGEEFGWRVYLQDRLFPLYGPYIGVVILGIIWGIWHAGNIYMGMNWPGQPILGIINITLLTIILAVIYGYAVLVTRSVWIAVTLHLITDTSEVAAVLYLSQSEAIFAFGGGVYSMIILGVFAVILLIVGSATWKKARELSEEGISEERIRIN